MQSTQAEQPTIGRWVAGYEVPVVNEREIRAGAGILFLLGTIAVMVALVQDSVRPLQPFGMLFMIDMLIRVVWSDRFSPSLALGRLIVRNQVPEWVGAPQKRFAWWLGFGLALISCASMGLLALPFWVTLALCSVCLSFLFLETAFGICVGCALQQRFGKQPVMYCPGGTCEVPIE